MAPARPSIPCAASIGAGWYFVDPPHEKTKGFVGFVADTELGSLWWASLRTGQHLLVSGACYRAWVALGDRWVYVSRAGPQGAPAGTREIVRVPWWR